LNVVQTWLDQTAKVEMRAWLTRDLLSQWMAPKRAFFIAGAGKIGVNPDQRIHEDARRLTELSAALAIGFFQSTLLLVSFIGVLWVLSEGFVLQVGGRSFAIPGFMVWAALIYAASGSWLSWRIGRPLIEIGAERYAREADLCFALVRVSEATDGIALFAGEQDERQRLDRELDQVIRVMRQFVSRLAGLTWVTAGYGWFAIVAPFLIAAPGYFSGQLTFGELMMTVGAFNQVQQALRWFVDNASNIADWRAALLRVMSFRYALFAIDRVEEAGPKIEVVGDSQSLIFDNVTVSAADRDIALDDQIVEVQPGEHVLIIGKPGMGKSMFFRAIAGLWPWGRGRLSVPARANTMFLPQRSYVAAGSLRDVLTYPAAPSNFSTTEMVQALKRTNLGHLIPALDRIARWDKELTADEMQHLAFTQLLIHKPRWIIGDEAICHLNEDDREIMFSLFEHELSNTAVVSITSNDAQHTFYSRIFHLISHPSQKTASPISGLPVLPASETHAHGT
jgi:putative ATP-binding cassette transporter